MNIAIFTESTKQQYSDFVTLHPHGSFLQSWSWGEFQSSQNKIVIRLGFYEQDALIGTTQLLKTKIPHLPGFYLYAPYGPIFADSNFEELALITLTTFITEHYPESWFTRLEPKQSLPMNGTVTQRIQPSKTLVTDISQDAEQLLAGMHPKTRYNIKVAQKHGVSILAEKITDEFSDRDMEANIALVELLTQTSSRQEFHSYPASYYESMIRYFANAPIDLDCALQLYSAYFDGKIIAGAMMIDHGITRTYLFGGSSDTHRNVMAPHALHWQAMQDARELGLRSYDWWGIETATGKLPGFVQFKLRWGGDQITYPPAIDVVHNKKYYVVYSALRKLNRLF